MNKQKIILPTIITLTAILIISAIFFSLKKENTNIIDLIRLTTQNTKLIDANTDHNQALDVAEYAVKSGISIPSILINFDTHSDTYVNYPVIKYGTAGVENWINEFLAKYPQVNELYWVMPDEEAKYIPLQIFFAEDNYDLIKIGTDLYGNSLKKDIKLYKFVFTPLTQKKYTQNFVINTNTGTLNEYVKGLEINKNIFPKDRPYKTIKVTTCTKNTLPDFKGKKVFLSIDADYISNSGFDTYEGFKIRKTPKGIEQGFTDIFKTIKEKNITPEILSMTLSPQYLPKEHHTQVEHIFEFIIHTSGKQDEIKTYKRQYDVPNRLIDIYDKFEELGLMK